MQFLNRLFGAGKQPADDESPARQMADVRRVPGLREDISSAEADCDELAGAYGRFGLDLTNPIPVNGPIGEIVYLNRLRWGGETEVFYHRLGNTISPVCKQRIDAYEIVTVDAKHWTTQYFSLYHSRRSTKAPEGMVLKRWPEIEVQNRTWIKLPYFGSTSFVDDFPGALSEVVAIEARRRTTSPVLPRRFAERVIAILTEHEGKWKRPDSLHLPEIFGRTEIGL